MSLVRWSSTHEEGEREEDKHVCPSACVLLVDVLAERLEQCEQAEDETPGVVEREGQLDPRLDDPSLPRRERRTGRLRTRPDQIEDRGHSAAQPDREQEGEDVPLADRKVEVQLREREREVRE